MYAALISQLSIIRFGSAGEIAGVNIPPPPDKPTGSQLWISDLGFRSGDSQRPQLTHNNSSNTTISPRHITDEKTPQVLICTPA
jgi:hypothetical protein